MTVFAEVVGAVAVVVVLTGITLQNMRFCSLVVPSEGVYPTMGKTVSETLIINRIRKILSIDK